MCSIPTSYIIIGLLVYIGAAGSMRGVVLCVMLCGCVGVLGIGVGKRGGGVAGFSMPDSMSLMLLFVLVSCSVGAWAGF